MFRKIVINCCFFIKNITQIIKNEDSLCLNYNLKKQLLYLKDRKIITSWAINVVSDYYQYITSVTINTGTLIGNNQSYTLEGSQGEGLGRTVNDAFVIALAETYERISVSLPEESRIIRKTYEQIGTACLNPNLFSFYTESQKKMLRQKYLKNFYIDENTLLGWIDGFDLLTNKKEFVPAQLNYIFYTYENPNEPFFVDTTTSGTAAHTSKCTAMYRAICETIERDSFLFYWMRSLSPKRVDLASIEDDEIVELLMHMKNQNFDLKVVNVTSDFGLPVFATLITKNNKLYVGLGSDINPTQALKASVREGVHGAQFDKSTPIVRTNETTSEVSIVRNFEEREEYWSRYHGSHFLDLFLSGPVELFTHNHLDKKFSPTEELSEIKSLIKQVNKKCVLVDVTNKLARDAGLWVFRSHIVDNIPFFINEEFAPLGCRRLYDLSLINGVKYENNERRINAIPHPFL